MPCLLGICRGPGRVIRPLVIRATSSPSSMPSSNSPAAGHGKPRVLIVGGVAGGASAAARARRLSEDAEIIIYEKGQFVSFANCGLPYFVGNVITDESKLLVCAFTRFRQISPCRHYSSAPAGIFIIR